jgi:dolichol kinase
LIARKLFHLLSILLIFPILFLNDNQRIAFSILFLISVFTIDILRLRNENFKKFFLSIFKSILKKNEINDWTGATYLAISYVLINIIFEKEVVIFSLLVLAICDPVAAIFGTYIKPNLKIYKKSINGLIGFYLSGFILSFLFFTDVNIFSKILAVLISGIVEVFTPIDDNLSVPLTTAFVLKFSQ